jgi:hypothetical protein
MCLPCRLDCLHNYPSSGVPKRLKMQWVDAAMGCLSYSKNWLPLYFVEIGGGIVEATSDEAKTVKQKHAKKLAA